MVAPGEPSGLSPIDTMTETGTADNLGESLRSTKSSKGRKLRQVLQKKQLDVLLQTYSSYIDEPDNPTAKEANDFYTITRKQSIEAPMSDRLRQTKSSSSRDHLLGDREHSNAMMRNSSIDDIKRMRKSESLVVLSSADESERPNDRRIAAQVNKKSSEDFGAKANKKGRKKNTNTKRKNKKEDLAEIAGRASDIVQSFTNRCGQKHSEIAEDFNEASKELRQHLKSGANIAFEDLADQFDGIVENLFVAESSEQRDDDGGRQRGKNQTTQRSNLENYWSQRQPGSKQNFRPLSHDEALSRMNKQVHQLLQPACELTHQLYETGFGPSDGVSLEVEPGRVVTFPTS